MSIARPRRSAPPAAPQEQRGGVPPAAPSGPVPSGAAASIPQLFRNPYIRTALSSLTTHTIRADGSVTRSIGRMHTTPEEFLAEHLPDGVRSRSVLPREGPVMLSGSENGSALDGNDETLPGDDGVRRSDNRAGLHVLLEGAVARPDSDVVRRRAELGLLPLISDMVAGNSARNVGCSRDAVIESLGDGDATLSRFVAAMADFNRRFKPGRAAGVDRRPEGLATPRALAPPPTVPSSAPAQTSFSLISPGRLPQNPPAHVAADGLSPLQAMLTHPQLTRQTFSCSRCGAKRLKGFYCGLCGATLPRLRRCADCGATTRGAFCGDCGAPEDASHRVPPAGEGG